MADQIKAEIADILTRKLKDPRIGFVTVTAVEVTDDLRYAKVFVSILGADPEQAKGIEVLSHACGFIRSELGRRLRVKFLPNLSFHLDHSSEKGTHILQLLEEIKKANEGDR